MNEISSSRDRHDRCRTIRKSAAPNDAKRRASMRGSRISIASNSRRSSSAGIQVRCAHAWPANDRRKQHLGKLAVVATIVIAIMMASHAASSSIDQIAPSLSASGKQAQSASSSTTTEPASTPQEDWKKGAMPSLYQIDPQWASLPYAQTTIGESGCGPTCLSMVYVHQTGKKDMNPVQMAAFSQRAGYVDAGATSWRFMTEGARTLGLHATELPADKETVKQKLSAGHPIIVVVGTGDFTTSGHYLVLCGIDDDGNVTIRDPNSAENTKRTWDIDRILSQARNLWAYV